MHEDVHQVVASRVQPKQLKIRSVRDPCERMPVDVVAPESPDDRAPGQASPDMDVVRYIRGVVRIEEWMGANRKINGGSS